MAPTIDRIETAGPDRRARRLVLSDGVDPRLTSASVLTELGLEAGDTIDLPELEAVLGEAEGRHAQDRAIRVLGYRDRSRRELDKRLADDGYPSQVRDRVIGRMVELNLVDDERFAATWARSRAAAGIGSRRIASELNQRGVDPALTAKAIEELDCGDELDRAVAALRGRSASTPKERERLIRRLVTRGFGLSTAIAAVDSPADTRNGGS